MLTAVLFVPIIATALLSASAARMGRLLAPPAAVIALSAAAVVTALSTGFMLSVLGVTALAQFPPLARSVGWSPAALDATELVPGWLGAGAGVLAAVLFLLAVRYVVRAARELRAASQLCAELGEHAERLVVIDDERADAYAVSGLRTGRIVVSRSMLQSLSPAEQRVLLAHEAAHLDRRHHVYVHLADLAAAANPFLRPVAREIRIGVERWADEIAAAESGDRQLVARALARAGLARMRTRAGSPGVALAASEVDLQRRVAALLGERPRHRPAVLAVLVALVLVLLGANAVTTQATSEHIAYADKIFDRH